MSQKAEYSPFSVLFFVFLVICLLFNLLVFYASSFSKSAYKSTRVFNLASTSHLSCLPFVWRGWSGVGRICLPEPWVPCSDLVLFLRLVRSVILKPLPAVCLFVQVTALKKVSLLFFHWISFHILSWLNPSFCWNMWSFLEKSCLRGKF